MHDDGGALQMGYGSTVFVFGDAWATYQRLGSCRDTKGGLSPAGIGSLEQLANGIGGDGRLAAAARRLDRLNHPRSPVWNPWENIAPLLVILIGSLVIMFFMMLLGIAVMVLTRRMRLSALATPVAGVKRKTATSGRGLALEIR